MIAVAGCVAQAEGEEIIRRAAGRRYRGRSADLSPPARVAGARRARRQGRSTPISRPTTSSNHLAAPEPATAIRSARRVGLPHRAGRLRQVLHLLRRALYARRGDVAAGAQDPRRERAAGGRRRARESRCSARTSTPITATDRTGRPWSLARLLERSPQIAGHRPAALHDQPSARHGRRPDRRPSRSAAADAVPASAGAVRLRPHPRGDEPPPQPRRLPCASSIACAPRGPISRSPPISSSAFPARPTRISPPRCSLVDEVGYARRILLQILAAARHARRRHGRSGAGRREGGAPAAPAGRRSIAIRRRSIAAASGRTMRRAVRATRPPCPASSSAARRICSRCMSTAPSSLIGTIAPVTVDRSVQQQPVRRARRQSLHSNSQPCSAQEPELRTPGTDESVVVAQNNATQIALTFDDNRLASTLVRPIRPEPRFDRAPARRRRQFARQSRHAGRHRTRPASWRGACSKVSTSG